MKLSKIILAMLFTGSVTYAQNVCPANQYVYSQVTNTGQLCSRPVNNPVFSGAVDIIGNSGIPARANDGTLWLASGFPSPVIGQLYIGDGTGWELDFTSRQSSTDTRVARFFDNGNATFAGSVTAPTFVGNATSATTATTASTATNLSGNITENQVTGLVGDLSLKAPIASPTFTGTVSAAIVNISGTSTLSAVHATSYSQIGSTIGVLCNGGSTGTFTTSSGPCSGTSEALEVGFPYMEQPTSSSDVIIGSHIFTRNTICTLSSTMGQAYAEATASTATEFLLVAVNPVESAPAKTIATIDFAANSNTGVWNPIGTGDAPFSPGDFLRLLTGTGNTPGLAGLSISVLCSVPH